MSKQRRIMCKECKREWVPLEKSYYANSRPVSITGNKRADLCPFCGSESPELIEFESPLAGLDIPRDGVVTYPNIDPIKEEVVAERQRAPGFISNNLIANLIREQENEEKSKTG